MPNTEQMIDRTKYKYESIRIIDPDTGKVRNAVSNGDAVARAMLAVKFDDLIKIAKKNGLEDKVAQHLNSVNPGQFRMIVGNALRGKVRKGEPVTIGPHEIKKLDQRVPVEEAPPAAKAAPKAKKVRPARGKKGTAAA